MPDTRDLTAADRDLVARAALSVDLAGHADIVTNADKVVDATSALYHLLGTEHANGEPSLTYDDRRGRCYEIAGFAYGFGDLADDKRARLVHGTMHGPLPTNVRIGHAWIEFGDRLVWEPIRGLIRDRTEWETHARPWAERTYTHTDVRRLMATSGHYGRWHESRYP